MPLLLAITLSFNFFGRWPRKFVFLLLTVLIYNLSLRERCLDKKDR